MSIEELEKIKIKENHLYLELKENIQKSIDRFFSRSECDLLIFNSRTFKKGDKLNTHFFSSTKSI